MWSYSTKAKREKNTLLETIKIGEKWIYHEEKNS